MSDPGHHKPDGDRQQTWLLRKALINRGLTKPGIRPIRKDGDDALGPLANARVRKQRGGEEKPKGKAKAKAKAKASSAGFGDWAAFAGQLDAGQPDAGQPDSDAEFYDSLVPFKRLRGSKFPFVPGKDEMGEDLPKDDMSPYTGKQKYVMQKIIGGDAEKKQEYDEAVATRDKAVIRAYVNSQVPKSATYAWAVTGDASSSTAEHTVLFQEKVWGVRQSILGLIRSSFIGSLHSLVHQ